MVALVKLKCSALFKIVFLLRQIWLENQLDQNKFKSVQSENSRSLNANNLQNLEKYMPSNCPPNKILKGYQTHEV